MEELKQRLEEHFRYVDETTLVVFGGHLLIEESLESMILTQCSKRPGR